VLAGSLPTAASSMSRLSRPIADLLAELMATAA